MDSKQLPTLEEMGLKRYVAVANSNQVTWYKTSAFNLKQAKKKAALMLDKHIASGKCPMYFEYTVKELG